MKKGDTKKRNKIKSKTKKNILLFCLGFTGGIALTISVLFFTNHLI